LHDISADFFEDLVRHLDAPVLIVDRDHKVVFLNDAACTLTGREVKEGTGQPVDAVLGLDSAASERLWLTFPVEESAEKNTWQEAICVLGRPSNKLVRILRRLWVGADGDPMAVFVLYELLGWEERYEEILTGSPLLFFETDPGGELIHGNRQMAGALGFEEKALDGKRLHELVAEGQQAVFEGLWMTVQKGQAVRDKELQLSDADGAPRPFWVSLFPVTDSGDGLVGVRGIAGDLAEQKGLAYALEAAEERFNVLFRESSDPILILSMEGDILSANPSFEQISGLRSKELFAGEKSWKDFVFEDDLQALLESVQQCADTHEGSRTEFRMKSAHGSVWFEQTISMLHDEHGHPRGLMAVSRDITRRKQREMQLKEEAELMQRRHRRAQELIAGLTRFSTKINELPPHLAGFLSGVCDILYEMYEPMYVLVHVPPLQRVAVQEGAELPPAMESGDGELVLTAMCRDVMESGSALYLNDLSVHDEYGDDPVVQGLSLQTYLGAPLRDATGRVWGTLSLFADRKQHFDDLDVELVAMAALQVAARLRAENQDSVRRELEDHLRQAQKMEAVGMLAGGIAHDFNNVLSGILGFASFLLSKVEEGSDIHRYLGLIEQSATQAADLTRQLLSFSRRKNIPKEPVAITAVIDDVMNILSHSLSKDIEISRRIEEELPLVLGDRGQLNQVIMNLCLNAAEAMADDGAGRIVVSAESRSLTEREQTVLRNMDEGSYICVEVEDNGPGMSEEIQQHIFDPFFTTKEHKGGSGLGLSIVYGIVSNHGGDVSVDSKLGEGTIFHVYIPVYDGPAELSEKRSAVDLRGTETVLVVDDEDIVREMVAEILKSSGYKTVCASSGEEGVDVLRAGTVDVDLVLLDMVMPGMDGEQTFDALRKIKPQVPVLLTTGFSQGESCVRVLNNGAKGLVRKPYKSEDLLQHIRVALGDGGPVKRRTIIRGGMPQA
jgi:PAS domain S-box-containing protein